MQTQGDQLCAAITMMLGSGQNQQQCQPSESSDREVPEATSHFTDACIRLLYSDSGDDKGYPQKQQHTFGLNCFAHPCHGVCSFRQSSDIRETSEWPENFVESSTAQIGVSAGQSSCPHLANGYCLSCIGHFDPVFATHFQHSMSAQAAYATDPAGSINHGLPMPINRTSTTHDFVAINEPLYPPDPLEEIGMSSHKSKYHSGQQTCDATVIGEEGQERSCGKICKNRQALSVHKTRAHTGQKACDVALVGEDGQPRLCGVVCKNLQALKDHKSKIHSGQKTCSAIVVGEDGQPRPCGTVCKNIQVLSYHRRRDHSGQQTCAVVLVGRDCQQRLCGKICRSARALSDHKRVHRKRKPVGVDENLTP